MKIVIDIPNSLYANLKNIQNGSIACKRILELVRNGTPYEERPQGHWINRCRGSSFCSVCGCEEPTEDIEFMNYCSNCGAKMKKEAENDLSI